MYYHQSHVVLTAHAPMGSCTTQWICVNVIVNYAKIY